MGAKRGSAPLFGESLPTLKEEPSRTQTDPNRNVLLQRFLHLTETALPAMARAQHWPIRFDHCFKRICLDHAFGDVWYKHLRKPAAPHLEGEPLRRATECAETLLAGGALLLAERNEQSLRWRGKLKRPTKLNKDARGITA